jgi:hypothetical protein
MTAGRLGWLPVLLTAVLLDGILGLVASGIFRANVRAFTRWHSIGAPNAALSSGSTRPTISASTSLVIAL